MDDYVHRSIGGNRFPCHVTAVIGSLFEHGYYEFVHAPVCCPAGADCCQLPAASCQLGKMPRASLRLLTNDSLIDKKMDHIRDVLLDANLNDIPPYKGGDVIV
jgi:hypothetical protein